MSHQEEIVYEATFFDAPCMHLQ